MQHFDNLLITEFSAVAGLPEFSFVLSAQNAVDEGITVTRWQGQG